MNRIHDEPPSALSPEFLALLAEQDEPGAAPEAELAGPWQVVAVPGRGYGVLRQWERLEDGHAPAAVFAREETARALAAVLPALGRDPLFHLSRERGPEGFAVGAVWGEEGWQTVGWLEEYAPVLMMALHLTESLVRSPAALATLLWAAGPQAQRRVGEALYAEMRRRVEAEGAV